MWLTESLLVAFACLVAKKEGSIRSEKGVNQGRDFLQKIKRDAIPTTDLEV